VSGQKRQRHALSHKPARVSKAASTRPFRNHDENDEPVLTRFGLTRHSALDDQQVPDVALW
jgi:hypothetical protein